MAPSPQDFGIGVAVVVAAVTFSSSLAQLLRQTLPRLGYLCFLFCLYEHATIGDRFFTRHLWEAMGISAAVVMFLDNRFPLFGPTCLAVIADFLRLYPTTAYKNQTGVTIGIAVALVAWRYLAREDTPEPEDHAPPTSGSYGGYVPGPPAAAPRPKRRRAASPARRSAPPPRTNPTPLMPGFGAPTGTEPRSPLLRRIIRRGATGRNPGTPEIEQSPWHGLYGQDGAPPERRR